MQGTSGLFHTGHAVTDLQTGRSSGRACTTQVNFAPMSHAEIAAYVRTGELPNVAGSFTPTGCRHRSLRESSVIRATS